MMSQYALALACVGLASLPSVSCAPSTSNSITLTVPSNSGVSANSGASFLVTNTFIANTVTGWSSLSGSQISSFPEHYTAPGRTFSALVSHDTLIPAGSKVSFRCNNDAQEPCNVVVFYYSCHPCESAKGNVGIVLTGAGYERTRCAPTFTTGVAGGIQHRMVGYVKTIEHGVTEDIQLDGALEFALFGLSNGNAVTCSDLDSTSSACLNSNDFCTPTSIYAGDKCRLATCVPVGPSHGLGCDVSTCARTELGL